MKISCNISEIFARTCKHFGGLTIFFVMIRCKLNSLDFHFSPHNFLGVSHLSYSFFSMSSLPLSSFLVYSSPTSLLKVPHMTEISWISYSEKKVKVLIQLFGMLIYGAHSNLTLHTWWTSGWVNYSRYISLGCYKV